MVDLKMLSFFRELSRIRALQGREVEAEDDEEKRKNPF